MLEPRVTKRFRLTAVCNNCKRRKVKCDRGTPCSTCVKSNTADKCEYEVPIWMAALSKKKYTPNNTLQQSSSSGVAVATENLKNNPMFDEFVEIKKKLDQLENIIQNNQSNSKDDKNQFYENDNYLNCNTFNLMIGLNPYVSLDETINFYENFEAILQKLPKFNSSIDSGAFSWHSLIRKDPCLFGLWKYMTSKRENLLKNSTSNPSEDKPSPDKILHAIKMYLELLFKHNRTHAILPVRLSDSNTELKNLVKLPKYEIIVQYIDIFFKNIYPFYPFLDEEEFRAEVSNLIEDNKLKIDNVLQYAILGQLVIVLRMSYLSLIPNNKNSTYSHPLTKYPILEEYVDWAKMSLNQFNMLSHIDISVVQCALYVWIYLNLSPESGEGPDRNQFQILSGMIFLMANSIGLNRDPESFPEVSGDAKSNHIRRKIWKFLVQLETQQSLSYGTPLIINPDFYDTKDPIYVAGCANSSDINLEKDIITSTNSVNELLFLSRKFLGKALVVNAKLNLHEILKLISEMELEVRKIFGSFEDYTKSCLSDSCSTLQTTNLTWLRYISLYITVKLFHTGVYHTLFLKYERINQYDLMFFYFKKTICLISQEFLPYITDILLILNPATNFASTLVISPSLETAVRRIDGFVFSSIIRIQYTIRNLSSEDKDERKNYYNSLQMFGKLLSACSKITLVAISKISHRYWYAWRIMKAHAFMLSEVLNGEFYGYLDKFHATSDITKLHLTESQINECIGILEKSLSRFRKKGIKTEWEAVSDVTEATNHAKSTDHSPESLSLADLYTKVDATLDKDLESLWAGVNDKNNPDNPFGSLAFQDVFLKEDAEFKFGFDIELKEFKEVMDSYFELDLMQYNNISESLHTQ